MIYYEDLWSLLECIYLGDRLTTKIGEGKVFVNPKNIKYLINRLVIINNPEYPEENIQILLDNGCRVISRIKNNGTIFQPYILRVNNSCMWNGKIVDEQPRSLNKLLTDDLCCYDEEKNILYFPKIKSHKNAQDNLGNLSALGWVLQQVGVNIIQNTPFKNLDVLKTRKVKI